MLALEMIGAFSDAPGSQGYPPVLGLFYPSQDNFIAVVNKPETLDYTRMAQVVKGVYCAVQAVARR